MKQHTLEPEMDNVPARPALVAYACLTALQQIKAAIADETLEDEACFLRISSIIEECERACGVKAT